MRRSITDRTTEYLRIGACLVFVMASSSVCWPAQTPPTPSTPPSATLPKAPDKPSVPGGQAAASVTKEPPLAVYMPDGQLKSHSIRVYVTRDVLPDQKPVLQLWRSHALTQKAENEAEPWRPVLVAPNQQWTEPIGGQQVSRSGTLLLFDLSELDFGCRAMFRVTPVVSWQDGDKAREAVGAREVNVGNIVIAVSWTAVVVGFTILLVVVLSWRMGDNPLQFLTGIEGHLSLAQTQIACWTLAVGSVVLIYGLIRLEIPNIPASLVALMGASLATGGIGYFQDAKKQPVAGEAVVAASRPRLALGDLVRVFPIGQEPMPSLAKAQMLFWTLLLLVLFVSKSILDGAIWEIPWELVALMGFSQAGYLVPKLAQQNIGDRKVTDPALG
jgi:hypothetical protein